MGQFLLLTLGSIIAAASEVTNGFNAEACRQGTSSADHSNNCVMLSRIFIGYGKMPDHIIYLPNSCLVPMLAPSKEDWSMGGDGPSILGPTVCLSPSYKDVRCPPHQLNYEVFRKFAHDLVRNNLLPVQCQDGKYSDEIALGIILVATGYPTEAYAHYNKMAQRDSSCPAIYYGRALAYAKSSLLQHDNAVNALNDYNNALKYIKTEDGAIAILERRAEVYQAMGRLRDASDDYSRILRNSYSNPDIYTHRGSILFLLEEYSRANDDFQKTLELTPDQPVALHYQALCFYHMGRLKEAVKLFQDILRLKPDYTEVIHSLGQAYQELGEFDLAIRHFNEALSVNPTDARSYYYKGYLQYHHGNPADALSSFKACTSLEPYNESCQFLKGASLATIGHYYAAIKEFTKVMLNFPVDPLKPSHEYTRAIYLREWCRYMHSHLELKLIELCAEEDLSAEFREHWVNSYPFLFSNYTEQPGIQPHIKDVKTPLWDDLSRKTQTLICYVNQLTSLIQYNDVDGNHLGNKRTALVMGLAALEVSQAVSGYFNDLRSHQARYGKAFIWKTMFDITVKWRRLIDANRPVMWLDQLPSSKSKSTTFVRHMNIMKGDKSNPYYLSYVDEVVDLTKNLALDSINPMASKEYRSELESANDLASLRLTIMKYSGPQTGDSSFTFGTKVQSVKDRKRKHLDGFTISLETLDQSNSTVLSIDTATKRARTQQYHAELDFLWEKFVEGVEKLLKNETMKLQESLEDTVLSLSYYFYNLMPISEGSGSVSYATMFGLLMAIGKEVAGEIPSGKIVEMDALLASCPEDFVAGAKSWMNLRTVSTKLRSEIPQVDEVLSSLRNCIEVINIDWTVKCN